MRVSALLSLATAVLLAAMPARAADVLRIGLLHTLSPAPLYIAMERGYFRDEGLDASFRFFEAAQPIAAAAVSGDIDIGITALTGGFFSLAGRGTLKVIAGGLHEQRGYEGTAILVSRQAYDAGLTSMAKLGGHSFGITQFGSSFHYMLGRIAEREGFDLKTVTLRPSADWQHGRRRAHRPGGRDDGDRLDGETAGGIGGGAHHRLGRRHRALPDHRRLRPEPDAERPA